jgi:rhodanese-related sulfurtransferase
VDRGKLAYYVAPSTLKQRDGKVLFESICASCHGMDGQGRFPPVAVPSYLSLHSDNEHFHIIKSGPPQKKGAPIVMPAFGNHGLSDEQIWAVARYLRSFEEKRFTRAGEADAKKLGVRFYEAREAYALWKKRDPNVFFLDVQSDIAYRIMGHIQGTRHIPPESVGNHLGELPKGKEIVVIDMFGSQGIAVASLLAKSGFKASYLSPGMVEWHIVQNYPVVYGDK